MAKTSKRTRVLLLTTELGGGGAERVVYEIATRLDPARFEPRVACLASATGLFAAKLREKKVRAQGLGVSRLAPWRARRLVRLLSEWRPQVLHAHLWHANVAARFAARSAPVRAVVSTVHVAEQRWRPWRFWIDRRTLRPKEIVACVSEGARKFTEQHGVPADRLRVVPNGIDCERFASAQPLAPADLGLGPDALPVLCAGRLDRQKGQDVLLRAWPEVIKVHPKAVLLLAGEGPMRRRLERAAASVSNVQFLGFREDVDRLMASAALVVAPSRWEGFGLVAAEAAAAGRPVVASRVTGLDEVVEDGKTGVLVPPGDAAALARAMNELLASDERCRSLGEAGRERARSLFTVERMVADYAALYDQMLSRKS